MATIISENLFEEEFQLADLVETYAIDTELPSPWWLTSLQLEAPRQNIHSLSFSMKFVKRAIDIIVSAIMLVILAPLFVLLMVLVRITSPGKAVFKQVRVGLNLREELGNNGRRKTPRDKSFPPNGIERRDYLNERRNHQNYGKPFTLYKFRTMSVDAEKNGAQFAQKQDPRITPLGRFMRKTRLDELPQLWNVLIGEMSLVGPRPERPEFIKELSDEIPDYLQRLGLKPGLTGVAQIVNGYDNNIESFRRKVAYDLLYLQNCSVWNDLKILVRTIGVIFSGSGAM